MTDELATIDSETAGAVAVQPDRQASYDLMLASMKGEVDLLEAYDSEEVQRALALGLLGAETEEEVFGSQGLKPWSELLGVPMEVRDVHFNPSRTEKGPGFYAVVNLVQIDTGEASVRHVGGWKPASQLLYMWSRGRLPFKAKLVEVATARSGQSAPLGLELV
jgi:hypothetical protein